VFKPAQEVGAARLRPAVSTAALGAALLVCLLALAPQLHFGSVAQPSAEAASPPAAVASANSGAGTEALTRRLRAHLEQQPRDARAWAILARLQFEADRFPEAAQAYKKALALPSKVANDPAVWCEYADALGMAQGGSLAGKPRELIDRALVLNPNHPKALEMAGSAAYEQGDYAAALRYWRPLLAALEAGSQPHTELVAAIARTERLAKVTLPPQRQ
jgi:cytochrome c-type biogenesis protein CcmH